MKKKILIADDNKTNLYLLRSILEAEGLDVIEAENGKDALDKARARLPDLIVSDILMPVMDGYALCREWKADERLKHIPLVFYTATYTEAKDETFALSLGADRFIVKPQDPETLMRFIGGVLEEGYDARQVAAKPLGEEMEFFRQHNEVLFRKLEKKVLDLEAANRKLKCLEEQYRLSFEHMTDIVWTIDTDFVIQKISPSVEKMLGYKAQDLIGRPVPDLVKKVAPEAMARAVAEIRAVMEGRSIPVSVYPLVARDGTIHQCEFSGAPIRRNGAVVGMVSVIRDITDRKKLEDALKKSEENYRAVFNGVVEGIYQSTPDGRFFSANPALAQIYGYDTPEEMISAITDIGHQVYVHPEERIRCLEILEREGEIRDFISQRRRRDGAIIWASTNSRAIRDEQGRTLYYTGTTQDITKQVEAEKALRESEVKYRRIAENMVDVVWTADLDFNVNYVSPSVERMVGESAEKHLRRTPEEKFPPESLKRIGEIFMEELEQEKDPNADKHRSRVLELEHYRADGTTIWISMNISFIRNDQGNAIGLQGVSRDITDRKRAEEIVLESEAQWRALFNESIDAILLTAPDGKTLAANPEACRIFGLSEEEICRAGRTGVVDVSDPRLPAALEERARTGRFRGELTFVRGSGEKFPGELASSIFRDRHGEQKSSIIIRDVSARNAAENALRESEQKLREAQNMAHLGFWRWDVKTGGVEWSEEVFNIFRLDPKEFTPHIDSIQALSPWPGYHERDLELIDRAMKSHVQGSYEQKFLRPDQSVGYYYSTFQGNYDDRGDLRSIVGTVLDITERKQAEERLRKALVATIQAISAVVEARDPYTAGHQRTVADLSRTIAKEMGLSDDRVQGIRMAAVIHDIGKISVPAEILSKPSRLNDIEYRLIQTHPRSGYDILKDVEFPWPIARMILEHHERVDGSGYPNALTADRLLVESRILAVADTVEAMASHRPYRPAIGIEKALEEIETHRASLYDAEVVDACLRLFREKNYHLPRT